MSRNSRSVLSRAAPPPTFTVHYGEHPDRVADVWVPPVTAPAIARAGAPYAAGSAGLVVLLHGGFWRSAYDRTHLRPLANALAAAGYLVATPEYRRTGSPGGGWPGTFDDVAAAVQRVPELVAERLGGSATVDSGRLIISGHSAGGQLALWAAAGMATGPAGVVALAPVADLRMAYELDLDRGAVAELLGGGPAEFPERYRRADPVSLVPLGCAVSVVHGGRDAQVPLVLSERFVLTAQGYQDVVRLHTPDADHFEVIDPESRIWPVVRAAFAEVAPSRVD